ncbi:hypothetical protein M3J09_004650 [Ascochyta lentis]
MSLVNSQFLWNPISSHHYGESLALFIKELTLQKPDGGVMLSATILLCSFELLALPGMDYERHLYGARTLINARDIAANGSSLEHASFWVYARHDVSLALVHERLTLISPSKWPVVPECEVTQEDSFARRVLWLLARIVDVRFAHRDTSGSDARISELQGLLSEIDIWWENAPAHTHGIITTDIRNHGLGQVWFCVPSAAAGCLYYHLAKILAFEYMTEFSPQSTSNRLQHHNWITELDLHCSAILSICFSPGVADGVLVVAVNPLFYAAKHTKSLSTKSKIWALLEDIEARLGFHTRNRVSKLQEDWPQAQTKDSRWPKNSVHPRLIKAH